jgi:hypothetical protein
MALCTALFLPLDVVVVVVVTLDRFKALLRPPAAEEEVVVGSSESVSAKHIFRSLVSSLSPLLALSTLNAGLAVMGRAVEVVLRRLEVSTRVAVDPTLETPEDIRPPVEERPLLSKLPLPPSAPPFDFAFQSASSCDRDLAAGAAEALEVLVVSRRAKREEDMGGEGGVVVGV